MNLTWACYLQMQYRGDSSNVKFKNCRLIIPILIKPGTSEYAVPPNGTLKSFDDLEIWLTEFFKKFVLRPGDSPSVMQFRSASPTQELQTEARMTYEIEGVNVQSWSTIEEARSFFAIFAPPRIPLSVIKVGSKNSNLLLFNWFVNLFESGFLKLCWDE
jgi:hypothetical protein